MAYRGNSALPSHGLARLLVFATVAVTLFVAMEGAGFGAHQALSATGSGDFQYSGARLILRGVDPYRASVDGKHWFLLAQNPNYLPLLLLVLMPLAALSFGIAKVLWLLCNCAMLVVTYRLMAERVGLRGWQWVLGAGMVAASGPLSIEISGGQQCILVLFMGTLALRSRGDLARGSAAALAVTKYSFVPLLIGLVLHRRWRSLGIAALIELGAGTLFCAITGSTALESILGPFRVAQGMARGSGNVMTIVEMLLPGVTWMPYLVASCAIVALTWAARQGVIGGDWLHQLAVGGLISLLTLPHLIYDYVALLPVLVCGIRLSGTRRLLVAVPVAMIWYTWLLGGLLAFSPYRWPGILVNLTLCLVAFSALVGARDLKAEADAEIVESMLRATET